METEYKKYQTKYKLPTLVDLQKDFPMKLETKETVLPDILDSMFNKISNVIESLEGVMTGEGFASMFEAGMLTPIDKDEVFILYRNMKSLLWEARSALTKSEEKEMADVIKRTYDIWSKNSNMVSIICKKLADGWKSLDVNKIADTIYHR